MAHATATAVVLLSIGTFLMVVALYREVRKLREPKDQPIMEYAVKVVGLSDDMAGFERWLEQLNNERWELITVLASPHIDGMFYGIFARPKRAGHHG